MSKAIETKALGPTNTKPSRIVAAEERARLIVSRQYEGTEEEEHRRAAEALAHKLGWLQPGVRLVGGWLARPSRFVWVLVED